MPDVFISYSRKDSAFVRQLHDALRQNNRDSWVDWEDIPLSAEWWQEICRGIEAADTFIFVISPDSLLSKVCGDELGHAIKQHKRLVPIVRREAVGQQVNQALAAHNWLFFRETDDFEATFRTLLKTLDTDLEHVRAHTRVLIRAVEWDNHQRAVSYTVRGEELAAAERWLAESANKEPRPNDLQAQYILASRTAQTARQRVTLVGVVVALVAALLLAALALVQYGVAVEAQNEAVVQAQLAATTAANARTAELLAEQRAAEAQSLLLSNYADARFALRDTDLALALAVAANTMPNAPLYAQRTLSKIALAPGTQWRTEIELVVNGPPVAVHEQRIAVGTNHAAIDILALEDGRHSDTLLLDSPVTSLAFNPDGSRLAAALTDLQVVVLDTADGSIIARMVGHTTTITSVAFSPDGTHIVSASGSDPGNSDSRVFVWDVETGTIQTIFEGHNDGVMTAIYSPDGRRVYSAGYDQVIQGWDAETGEHIITITPPRPSWIFKLDFSADGSGLAAALDYGQAVVFDPNDGQILLRLEGMSGRVYQIAFTANGEQIVTSTIDIYGGNDTALRVWNAATGEVELVFGGYPFAPSHQYMALADNGQMLVTTSPFEVRAWTLSSSEAQFKSIYNPPDSSVTAFALHPDGVGMLIAWRNTPPRFYPTGLDNTPRLLQSDLGYVFAATITADGQRALMVGDSNQVEVIDLESGQLVHQLDLGMSTGFTVAASPDSTRIAAVSADGEVVRVWDLASGELRLDLTHDLGSGYAVAWSPDGNLLVVGGTGGEQDSGLRLYNSNTGELVHRFGFGTPYKSVFAVAFSPDGRYVASGVGDKGGGGQYPISLWDTASGQLVRRMVGHDMSIVALVFSPDGTTLLSGAHDGTARLWEVDSGLEIAQSPSVSESMSGLGWNGESVYVMGTDSSVLHWRLVVSVENVLTWLRSNRYLAELTCDERVRYSVQPLCDVAR
jgi:WD40 repeat protein